MDTVITIVVALVLIGAVLFFLRRGAQKLPEAPPLELAPPKVAADAPAAPRRPTADRPAESQRAEPAAPTAPAEPTPALAPLPTQPDEAVVEEAPASLRPSLRADGPLVPKAATEAGREHDIAAFKKGLRVTRGGFIARLAQLFRGGGKLDQAVLDQAEELLIAADVGMKTTTAILGALKEAAAAGELTNEAHVWTKLAGLATDALDIKAPAFGQTTSSPLVILVIGVNGVGKTTTIGKLASRYQRAGKRVLLAAGDTFRAAAVLQLEVWGRRVECPVVKGKEGADPGSVIFDAIKRAQTEGIDVVIADTAGRLHTKVPLMDELKKVSRTVTKALDRPADEVLLVLDATTGQNAVQQVQMFREAMEITGIALTKLDGTAKGGVVLGIVNEHRIPIRFVGLGEKVEDLREFDSAAFSEALFTPPEASNAP